MKIVLSPFQKGLCMQESKQQVTRIVPLVKNVERLQGLSTFLKHFINEQYRLSGYALVAYVICLISI